MAAVSEHLFPNPTDPPLGTVLGKRYQLVTKFYKLGETRYLARDLRSPGQDVELRIGGFNGRRFSFLIKSRFKRGRAAHLKRACTPRQNVVVRRLTRVRDVLGIRRLTNGVAIAEEVA